jgi:predicted metal-binding membrane protein
MTRHGRHSASRPDPGALALIARLPAWSIALVALSLAAWAFLAWIVVDMGHPFAQLTMPASARWTLPNVLAILAMWAVMMAAMMLPSALPMVLTFVNMGRRGGDVARGRSFVAAYLAVWFAFSAVATLAQWALLLIAGVYQFSRLKRICLSRCQSPLGFLLGAWRPGVRGAFVMGAQHGLYCLGCCWALMALLFVGGVMNLAWVAALSIAVALEKLLPGGERIATVLGIALVAVGCIRLVAVAG